MRKAICLLLLLTLPLALLSGCGAAAPEDNGKLKIVATIFPEYDWVRQILGERAENAELVLLLDNGVDLHSFQPSVQDMVQISDCDLLLYVGGVSDKWIDDALDAGGKEGRIAIDLLSVLGSAVKEEEFVEGMQAAADEGEVEAEYDEHVWLSLRNAARFCEAITEALCTLDPEGQEVYAANRDAYLQSLAALDGEYQETVNASRVRTLLFGDRFPFRYLTDDYDLDYYAAFVGCSAETEASFETVAFLADKLNTLELHAVLTIETGDTSLAKTIIETSGKTDAEILQLDSMQAVTAARIAEGASYLQIMRDDLAVLRQALA